MKQLDKLKNIGHKNILIAVGFFLLHFTLIFSQSYYASKTKYYSAPSSAARQWHTWLDLNRWDSGHYKSLVEYGYVTKYGSASPSAGWYPGYPLIAAPIKHALGIESYLTFSILSFIFTFLFWLSLWSKKLESSLKKEAKLVVSICVLLWPGSFFYFAGMTEPLVALICLWLFYFWNQKTRYAGFILMGFATMVKQVFLPLQIVQIALYIKRNGFKKTIPAQFIIGISGYLLFGFYCLYHFKDFFYSTTVLYNNFGHGLNPLNSINMNLFAKSFSNKEVIFAFICLQVILIYIGMVVKTYFTKRKWSYSSLYLGLCAWAYLAVHITTSATNTRMPWTSILRYQTANIFFFIILGQLLSKRTRWVYLALLPLMWLAFELQRTYLADYWRYVWVS